MGCAKSKSNTTNKGIPRKPPEIRPLPSKREQQFQSQPSNLNATEETALTTLEIKSVQESWNRFHDGFPQTGIDVFCDYLTAYPASKIFFGLYGNHNLSIAEFRKEPPKVLATHLHNRLEHYGELIKTLDDPDEAEKFIERFAHDLFLDRNTFEDILGLLLTLFHKIDRDHHLDAAAVKAWEKFLNMSLKIAFKTYEDAAKAKAKLFACIPPLESESDLLIKFSRKKMSTFEPLKLETDEMALATD